MLNQIIFDITFDRTAPDPYQYLVTVDGTPYAHVGGNHWGDEVAREGQIYTLLDQPVVVPPETQPGEDLPTDLGDDEPAPIGDAPDGNLAARPHGIRCT